MKRNWKLGVLVAVLIRAALPVLGQAGISTFRGPSGCNQDLIRAVGLTAAQQSALEVLRQQTADAIKPIFDQIAALHQQTEMALGSASPDPCAIGNLEIQGSGLRAQIQTIHKDAEAAFVASLPADQQAKYAAFIAANPECGAFPSRPTTFWIGVPHP
jgi:hypothetical protein